MQQHNSPGVLRTFSYRHDAEAVKTLLAANGIEAAIVSDDCGAVDPALGFVRGIQLLVPADQLDAARDVLEHEAQ
jgi:hypothetical protein